MIVAMGINTHKHGTIIFDIAFQDRLGIQIGPKYIDNLGPGVVIRGRTTNYTQLDAAVLFAAFGCAFQQTTFADHGTAPMPFN